MKHEPAQCNVCGEQVHILMMKSDLVGAGREGDLPWSRAGLVGLDGGTHPHSLTEHDRHGH